MTVTLLNRGNRGPGQFDTPSALVDASIVTAVVQFDLHANEMSTTKIVRFDTFFSPDNGVTWRHDRGAEFQGPFDYPPVLYLNPSGLIGRRVKAVISLPQQINCGVVLWVNELPPHPPLPA